MLKREIYTVLRDGQQVDTRVLWGLVLNNCSLIPITSQSGSGKFCRVNVWENWKRVFTEYLKTDKPFISGMDSDVILREGTYDALLKGLERFDLVVYPSKNQRGIVGHGLWAAKRDVIKTVPFLKSNPESCPFCLWLIRLRKKFKQFKFYKLRVKPLEETKRPDRPEGKTL